MQSLSDGWPALALGVLACGGALAKCGYELATGNALFVGGTDAFTPSSLAHFVGVASGVLVVFASGALARSRLFQSTISTMSPSRTSS